MAIAKAAVSSITKIFCFVKRPQIVLDGSLKDLAKLNKWKREDANKSKVVFLKKNQE